MFFQEIAELLTFFLSPFVFTLMVFLLMTSCSFSTNSNTTNSHKTNIKILSLTMPMFFLTLLSMLNYRSFSGSAVFGYFNLSPLSSVWFICVSALFIFSALNIKQWSGFLKSSTSGELLLALFFLWYLWFALTLVSSVFSFLLFLEIAGLSLLIFFSKTLNIEASETSNNGSFLATSTNLASITFLWASILSMLFLLLGLALNADKTSFQFDTLNITSNFLTLSFEQHNVYLCAAIFLKMMLAPWQGLLFAFYKSMPTAVFSLYLSFYYMSFLTLTPLHLIPVLMATCPPVVLYWVVMLTFSLTMSFVALAQSSDLSTALALSSVFNMSLMMTLFLN